MRTKQAGNTKLSKRCGLEVKTVDLWAIYTMTTPRRNSNPNASEGRHSIAFKTAELLIYLDYELC